MSKLISFSSTCVILKVEMNFEQRSFKLHYILLTSQALHIIWH